MTQNAMVPMTVFGRTRIVSVPVNADAEEFARQAEEQARLINVAKRRMYYDGEQYAAENATTAAALKLDPLTQRVPEHKRQHAYSTQIQEAVDFLADRIGEGFTVEAADQGVQDVINAMTAATDVISAETDDGEQVIVTDDILRDALVAGDVACNVRWDPIESRPFLEFWESENVEFVYATSRKVTKVVRSEVVWRTFGPQDTRQVVERSETSMQYNEAGEREAQTVVYIDNAEEPEGQPEWHGVGRIPWCLLRADSKSLRSTRGESPISEQAMETADRYNAVEQVAWLIARYNSHANVAVIGDGASLKLESDGRVSKDVADVLTFPGGTALQVLTLPTDPDMIVHQRAVLADGLYSTFGLTRVEPDTLQGLGSVSGYALEILNQKTDGTFKRIRRHWRKDWVSLLNLVLDVTAWQEHGEPVVFNPTTFEFTPMPLNPGDSTTPFPVDGIPMLQWWTVDPAEVFPDRAVEIRMGSGYIVDDVRIRDDFVAGLISQEEALRQRGYTDQDLKRVVKEVKAAKPAPTPAETGAFGKATTTVINTSQTAPGVAAPAGTAAGSTVAAGSQRG